jgi:hypothetical protein
VESGLNASHFGAQNIVHALMFAHRIKKNLFESILPWSLSVLPSMEILKQWIDDVLWRISLSRVFVGISWRNAWCACKLYYILKS